MTKNQNELTKRHFNELMLAAEKYAKGKELKLLKDFVKLQFENFSSEDLLERSIEDLCAVAATQFKLLKNRRRSAFTLEVQNSESNDDLQAVRSYVHVIMPDMPFIIDTIGMAITRESLPIQLTINNRIIVQRDNKGTLLKLTKNKVQKTAQEKALTEASIIMEFGPEFSQDKLHQLEVTLRSALEDLTLAVEDWQPMRQEMQAIIDRYKTNPPPVKKENIKETIDFLEWLLDNHFTYLGYREYYVKEKKNQLGLYNKKNTGLGILRDRGERRATSSAIHSDDLKKQIENGGLLILTKANSRASVHRDSHLDYIGIKEYNDAGKVIGERRFLGLYTSVAYNRSPRYIPVLRQKVDRAISRSGLQPSSHAGKALTHILETFPRDELFQSTTKQLLDTATGLLQIQERKRVRIFMRRDAYRRFFAFTVYVPRDYYNTQVRNTIEDTLKIAVKGYKVESQVEISDSTLARVYLVVWTKEGRSVSFPRKEYETILRRAVRPWNDSVERELEKRLPRAATQRLMQRFKHTFPYAYIEDVSYYEASHDVERLAQLGDSQNEIALSLYRPAGFPESCIRFKIFRYEQSIPISTLVPMLENLGFKAISERPYKLNLNDDAIVWIQDLELVHSRGEAVDPAKLREPFQDAFTALYNGQCENDVLNRLVADAELSWREVVVLRAYTRYLRQSKLPYSMKYLMETLLTYPDYAKLLFKLFSSQFGLDIDKDIRSKTIKQTELAIKKVLSQVNSLDKDRILRAYYSVIKASLRTNFYQLGSDNNAKQYISFKLDPQQIDELPLPKPKFEIWVYSPEVEGVHLRGGEVARGGLRWSDRPEDFRTEVLGLVKAQMVKNSVIVPVGAKGGFIVRNPDRTSRETWFEQGRECYKTFLRGLLDVSDNLHKGKVVPAPQVIAKDAYDPYLVVAADKGTATFSDTANAVAAEYDFWLGDAFASGGSVGYDHKVMGITAKGAWESVKRHFLEMGKDIQTEDFTVVGIGDMAGDVFGNGMLLSKHIRLQAAFNHMHIFIDPNPDAAKSFKERKRLFNLPRSSWDDYDRKLLSKGGGIYSRQSKEIELSEEAQKFLNIDANKLSPNQLMQAILKAKVELLWNGGIGTYARSSDENHTDVGDPANDLIRVKGKELGATVIGEGGNLGCTQKGRIEFALNGGRVNTDFIDNSGGVDSSDHEVNIKILLNLVTQKKKLSKAKRDQLLARMTDEVSEHVLNNNYLQSQAISILESRTSSRTREYMHVVDRLEASGRLNREIEFLPSKEIMLERMKTDKYLTRPEIATIVSYSKMALSEELLAGKLVDDEYLLTDLVEYFPEPLQKSYAKLMPEHRLSREIISTQLANEIVNRMGPAFFQRLVEESGKKTDVAAKAYLIARDIFSVRDIWDRVSQLDRQIPTEEQYRMYIRSTNLVKHAARWLVDKINSRTAIRDLVTFYASGVKEIYVHLPKNLGKEDQRRYKSLREHYSSLGLNDRNAKRIASSDYLYSSLDIIAIADKTKSDVHLATQTYSKLGQKLHLHWLHNEIVTLKVHGQWQAMARNSLRDQAYALHRELTNKILKDKNAKGDVSTWLKTHENKAAYLHDMTQSIRELSTRDFSTLSVLVQEFRQLL